MCQTGKSTYLKERFSKSLVFDFLDTDLVLEFSRRPALLREQLLAKDARVLAHPIILDEVRVVPHILDEFHWLIENKGLQLVDPTELRPLMAFTDEYRPHQTRVVCNERIERIQERTRVLPWRIFCGICGKKRLSVEQL